MCVRERLRERELMLSVCFFVHFFLDFIALVRVSGAPRSTTLLLIAPVIGAVGIRSRYNWNGGI